MILSLMAFELRRRLKMISTWIYAAVLAAAGFFMMLAAGGMFRSVAVAVGNDRVPANSPMTLFGTTSTIALLGLFTVTAVFGQAAYQDFGHNTWMIIFTKNIRKTEYLIGRFLGAYVFSAALFLSIGLGQLLASGIVAFSRPENLGATMPLAYLWPYVTQVWPMLFLVGALCFSLAALTRRMAPVYVAAVVLVLGYLLSTVLLEDVQNRTLAAMLDPFGFLSFDVATRYWTPAERNRDLVSLWGVLGANRLIWTGVGAVVLGLGVRLFRPTVTEQRGAGASAEERSSERVPFPVTVAQTSTAGWLRVSLGFARLYLAEIFRSAIFWAFVLAGLALVTITMLSAVDIYGTATWPVTYKVLELAQGGFGLFTLILLTFYAGELVWRERDVGASDVFDATPLPTWAGALAKLLALWGVAAALEGVVGLAALVAQLSQGYTQIELHQYLINLFVVDLSRLMLLGVLALAMQVVVNHKYLGHLAMVLYYISNTAMRGLGVEDPLARYASGGGVTYSDMNGYGTDLATVGWFRLLWGGFALALLVGSYGLLMRGRDTAFAARLRAARARLGTPTRALGAAGLLVFLGTGAWTEYQTRIVNRYVTDKTSQDERAEYEQTYRSWLDTPQPHITAADLAIDVYPDERRLEAKGTYRLRNQGSAPVTRVMLALPETVQINTLSIPGATESAEGNARLGVHIYELATPLGPGAETDLRMDLTYAPHGMRHGGDGHSVVGNGTFWNNGALPVVGYQEDVELTEKNDREEYGLAPKQRMANRDDPRGLAHNYIRSDSDLVTYAMTVSTSADQLAIAPGTLTREWTEDGRRYFQYTMSTPTLNFFSVLSARYAVMTDEWNGVHLEINHHPTHTANLDRMMQGMKDALAYCTTSFGPYQHPLARIVEFPRYATFAQSFPNTIPFSESIGFIARVREDDPDDLDYPYYVTAHEIAHQWWAHQVIGANVRGATMTSETMAQYTALMIMKARFGPAKMRRFLKFELDRYLMGRAMERERELPLADNENQPYIHYQKGSLAMYALADAIGEDRVNRAMKRYIERVRFQGPPYTTSTELISYLRDETPMEQVYLLDDLFETITLYDNRVTTASMTQNAAGGWDVTMTVVAKKLRSDDKGEQTELPFEEALTIGALDDDGNALHTEKRTIKDGTSEVAFTVPTKPATVGIDPLNILIDRDSDDNVTAPSGG